MAGENKRTSQFVHRRRTGPDMDIKIRGVNGEYMSFNPRWNETKTTSSEGTISKTTDKSTHNTSQAKTAKKQGDSATQKLRSDARKKQQEMSAQGQNISMETATQLVFGERARNRQYAADAASQAQTREVKDDKTLDEKAQSYWSYGNQVARNAKDFVNGPLASVWNMIAHPMMYSNPISGSIMGVVDGVQGTVGAVKSGVGAYNDVMTGQNPTLNLMNMGLSTLQASGAGYTKNVGIPMLNNYGKYHGFGNRTLNNIFDRLTAKTFEFDPYYTHPDGSITPYLETPSGQSANYLAKGGESWVFYDPNNPGFVLKSTAPLTGARRTNSLAIDFVNQFNSPGDIVSPIRFAGRSADGRRMILRQELVTPLTKSGHSSQEARNMFKEAALKSGLAPQDAMFTDEALGTYGDYDWGTLMFKDPKTRPIWSDVRESNVGFDKDGNIKLYDYVFTDDSGAAAGIRQMHENAEIIHSGKKYKMDFNGKMYYDDPGFKWGTVKPLSFGKANPSVVTVGSARTPSFVEELSVKPLAVDRMNSSGSIKPISVHGATDNAPSNWNPPSMFPPSSFFRFL